MNILGLVTEYNPFHNGHLHHLNASKKLTNADLTVAVMSGQFVQRGEPAIFDKWTRAAMAVHAGVDLVLELPTVFAVSSAEYFAYGAVDLLNNLGLVTDLVFGSESGKIEDFRDATKLLVQNKVHIDTAIGQQLSTGISYPKARQLALDALVPQKDHHLIQLLNSPNNILGLEYLKALESLNSCIQAHTIPRIASDYNATELQGEISSATAIRKHLQITPKNISILEVLESLIPPKALVGLSVIDSLDTPLPTPVFPDALSKILLYRLRSMSSSELSGIHDVKEGLENRIKNCAQTATSWDELLSGIKSKRYTLTRVQRILIKTLLGITDAYVGPTGHLKAEYARVLAFNDQGRKLLATMRKSSSIPVITKPGKAPLSAKASKMLSYDLLATDLYALLATDALMWKGGQDYSQRPLYVTHAKPVD